MSDTFGPAIINNYCVRAGFHCIVFHHVGTMGVTWEFSTKFDDKGLAMREAFRRAEPVLVTYTRIPGQRRQGYFESLTRAELPSDTMLRQDMHDASPAREALFPHLRQE